jgi:hypothetical protein
VDLLARGVGRISDDVPKAALRFMTVTQMRDALDELIAQGHGALPVCITVFQYTEGSVSREECSEMVVEPSAHSDDGDLNGKPIVHISW